MLDTQITELAGRHYLISQLLAGGVEVAIPVRDRGVDLIAYIERDDPAAEQHVFIACPIQLKASTSERFELDRKYEKVRNLLLVYAWKVNEADPKLYALAYREAENLLSDRRHTLTRSWIEGGKYSLRPGESWLQDLGGYLMEPAKWREKIRSTATPRAEEAGQP